MLKLIYSFLAFLLILNSCTNKNSREISFYNWKAEAKSTALTDSILKISNTKTIFMHYFDVEAVKEQTTKNDGIYPLYVVKDIDKAFKKFNVIPTIYITTKAIKQTRDIGRLARKIDGLIREIHSDYFDTIPHEIQIDCDWNESTKDTYFTLLDSLNTKYTVSATIRLHQIKYADKTGIPPVAKGALMVYNIGDLKDMEQNSILDPIIVSQYINSNSEYPLPLDIALPLFSQTVVKNTSGKIRLINSSLKDDILSHSQHFKMLSKNTFSVIKDTLYHGFYIAEGYTLKTENTSEQSIIESYNIIKNSKLKTENIIFYHLDGSITKEYDISKIIKAL